MTLSTDALIGIIGALVFTIIGALWAYKLGLGPNQEKLVSTLKQIVEAQSIKITNLEEKVKELTVENIASMKRIELLEALTVQQAIIIQEFHPRRSVQELLDRDHRGGS